MNIGIVGAGVGGLSLARAIERMSLGRAVVLEQSPVLRPNLGGSLALSGGAVVLNKLGLGRELGLIQNPLLEIEQRSNGRLLALHDLEGIVSQSTYLGPTGKSLIGTYMRDDLQKTLVDSLAEGTLLLGRRLVALEIQSDKVLVKALNDGNSEEYVFDALIGADGIRSETRRLLWGEFSPSYTGFQVVYGVALRSTREHPHRVTQNYRPGALWMSASAGPADKRRDIMALAYRRPLKDAAAFGWLTGHQISDLHAAMDRFDAPDEVRAIAKSAQEAASGHLYDWPIYYQEPLRGWSRGGRVCLLGDAAHATSPFIGQGANQAILDAYSLAKNLESGLSLSEAFVAFERARYSETAKIIKTSELIGRMETASPPWSSLRDFLFARTSLLINVFAKSLEPKF